MWPHEQHLCKFLQALHSCIMGKKSYKCYKLYGAQGWMWLCIAPVSAPDHDSQLSEWQVVPSIFLLIAQNKQLTPSILWMGQAALGQWVVAFRKIMVHLVKPDNTGSWPETFQWLVPVWIPAGGWLWKNDYQTEPGNHHLTENSPVWSKSRLCGPSVISLWVVIKSSDTKSQVRQEAHRPLLPDQGPVSPAHP